MKRVYLIGFFIVLLQVAAGQDEGHWDLKGSLPYHLQEHKCALLPGDHALLAGGTASDAGGMVVRKISLIFDLKTGTWKSTSDMLTARAEHKLVTMLDGKVIAIGGAARPNGEQLLSDCEIYEPKSGKWERTGKLNTPRVYASAVLMKDGRIFVAGGAPGCEIYDPKQRKWANVPGWNGAESVSVAVLGDGRILCVTRGECQIFSPKHGSWVSAVKLNTPRAYVDLVLLKDGRLLAIGGDDGSRYLTECEIYDPKLNKWSATGSLSVGRALGFSSLLPDGWVIVTGGRTDFPAGRAPLSTDVTEIFDPEKGQWSKVASLNSPTQESPGVVFSTGQVMICGGWSGARALNTTEVFTPPKKKK